MHAIVNPHSFGSDHMSPKVGSLRGPAASSMPLRLALIWELDSHALGGSDLLRGGGYIRLGGSGDGTRGGLTGAGEQQV